MATAGDPRRGQRGDTQRSRQKLVTDLRRRQRIRPIGLAAWAHFDATRIDGLADGDIVTQWKDISGNGRHVSAPQSGREPIYRTDGINGQASVDFMPFSSDTLQLERTPVTTAEFSRVLIFVVIDAYNFGTDPGHMVLLDRDNPNELVILQFFEDDETARVNAQSSDGDNFRSATSERGTNVGGGSQIIEAVSEQDKLEVRVDGTTVGTDESGDFTGFTPETEFNFGAHNDVDALFGEVVVLKDDQVDDRDAWYSDLAAKWGIA